MRTLVVLHSNTAHLRRLGFLGNIPSLARCTTTVHALTKRQYPFTTLPASQPASHASQSGVSASRGVRYGSAASAAPSCPSGQCGLYAGCRLTG